MSERKTIEKLVESGTWVDGFNVARLRQADGTIVDLVEIDPRLRPKVKRVWLYFGRNQRWSSQEFDEHIKQQHIADWRFRRAQ